ncbi:MAG: hypothetical protein NTZ14_10185 [Hyphomicrobiales bacterium]|nr:hypothetical protein [Hyphomicrobiales bacterium]
MRGLLMFMGAVTLAMLAAIGLHTALIAASHGEGRMATSAQSTCASCHNH